MNGDSSRGSDRHASSRHHRDDRADVRERDDRRDRDRDRGDRDRRRSRSPRGHRGSRREDGDSYASSRDHRDRERERNFSGRDDRRGERAWDRDRGPRAGGRDDDRRRERVDYGDRRRGGGREREDYGRERERKRSATPPPKKREPTPDLAPFVSILERPRRMTQWDIKPTGYEGITAEQAKLSGMFPLPGAPRQQPMDPQRLQALVNQPQNAAVTSALKPSMARQSKRVFVYNIPASTNEQGLVEFFNLQLNGINIISGNDPVTSASISTDRSFAMLEFKNPMDATVCLALDGISMFAQDDMTASDGTANGSAGLSIRRPKDYISPPASEETSGSDGVLVSNVVEDSLEKILITGLGTFLEEGQVVQLLTAIGALKSFVLAKDTGSDQSRGFAFCQFVSPSTTEVAIEGLQNFDIGGSPMTLKRACIGQEQISAEMGVNTMSMLAATISSDVAKSRVLQLLNMTTPEDLMHDADYQDLKDDTVEECNKFAKVLEIKIPRPAGARSSPGVGKIYIKFESIEGATKAMSALAGRKFDDRTVVCAYFGEEYFDVNAW